MVLWETEFYALSFLDGEMKSFRGMFIEAETYQNALKVLRKMDLDYLQLTGDFFDDFDSIKNHDEFYEKLTSPKNIVKDMDYDAFMNWLELAECKKDLEDALERFKGEEGMEDYVNVIKIFIRDYEKKSNNSKEGDENLK